MKLFCAFLLLLFTGHLKAQVLFSNVDSKLKIVPAAQGTDIFCTTDTMSIRFHQDRTVSEMDQTIFLSIDSQMIQIIPLEFSGYKKDRSDINAQKELLKTYSEYELNYIRDELNLEVINPQNQWVMTGSKGWLVWYYKLGGIPANVKNKVTIQLFASTIINNKILSLNAPVPEGADFTKAGLIINELMESMKF